MNRCYQTNKELIQSLNTPDYVKQIMIKVDRGDFTQSYGKKYCDKPLPLLMKQTISAPHMHAKAIEYLYPKLKPGMTVLDVGSGSGYLTACFGYLVNVSSPTKKTRGKVVGLDIHESLVNYSVNTIQSHYKDLFTYVSRFKLVYGSGWDGFPKRSKKEIYDAIHVGASCDSIPIFLLHQLKKQGKMVLPLKLGNENSYTFCIVTKDKNDNIYIETKESVRYVPLIK